ncbi:hypothetical protein JHK84_048306 [Glycine max]|nr:hypothetical protein JHK85_048906 [Glycine max]KAG5103337.1 hypothetical protein JHK84_048306 [Glycine max]
MESWLESKGLEDANQVLAYFALSKIGETPIDGRTDTNLEGLIVLDKEVFQKQMLEKLIWICSVMLVGAPHGGVSVGVMDKEFRSEVGAPFVPFIYNTNNLLSKKNKIVWLLQKLSSLITELESAASSEKGLTFEEAMEECLCAYSRAIAHFPTVVKEISKHGIFLSYCAIWEISEISDHGIFLTPLFEPFVIPLLLEKLSSSLHSAKGILSTERGQSALESFDSYQRSVIELSEEHERLLSLTKSSNVQGVIPP